MGRRKRKTRNWVADKEKDVYTRQARQAGYRSRAVYKLGEIDERDRLFSGVRRVLDLGAAPGGWSQYALRKVGDDGLVVAVDVLAMEPIEDVIFVHGDFTDPSVQQRLRQLVAPGAYDLVISDMAPNITGIADVDQARAADLAESAVVFAERFLTQNGHLLVKVFEGSEAARIRKRGESMFRSCSVRKPEASRDRSREFYLLMKQPRAERAACSGP